MNTQYLVLGSWTTYSTWGWVHGQHTVPGVGFMDNIQYLGVDSWTTHSTWGWVLGQHTVPGGGFRDNTQYLACWGWVQRHTSTPWCPFSSPHRQHHGNIKSGVGHSPPVLAENVHKNIKITTQKWIPHSHTHIYMVFMDVHNIYIIQPSAKSCANGGSCCLIENNSCFKSKKVKLPSSDTLLNIRYKTQIIVVQIRLHLTKYFKNNLCVCKTDFSN